MEALKTAWLNLAWLYNAFGVVMIALTYFFYRRSQSRGLWAGIGCLLLLIAATNAFTLGMVGVSSNEPVALLGMIVFGPLGSTFIANWLTHQVEPREPREDMWLKVMQIKAELEKEQREAEEKNQIQQ